MPRAQVQIDADTVSVVVGAGYQVEIGRDGLVASDPVGAKISVSFVDLTPRQREVLLDAVAFLLDPDPVLVPR